MLLNFSNLCRTESISLKVSSIFFLTSPGSLTSTKKSSLPCSFGFTMHAPARTESCQYCLFSSQCRLLCCSTSLFQHPLLPSACLFPPMSRESRSSFLSAFQARPGFPCIGRLLQKQAFLSALSFSFLLEKCFIDKNKLFLQIVKMQLNPVK